MSTSITELDWLRACYNALWRHVNEDHGLAVEGTAGQIEAVHMRAHRREGTAWHDAWTLPHPTPPDDDEVTGR
jgi:hypothetical protein